MVASPEKLQERVSPFFITIRSRLAISVTQICILMALALFHYHQKQIGYKRHPNLYLDGICTFSIEVFQREVLFYLLEQQFNFPAFTVNFYNFVRV